MAKVPNGGSAMEEIGGLIVHAEAAQAALDKGLATHSERAKSIMLLVGLAEEALTKLRDEARQIGPRVEEAGARAVREEVRKGLAGANAVVEEAARVALAPLMNGAVERIETAYRAANVLDRQAERFSNRMLAIVAAGAIGALALIGFGTWAALAWQRSELASLAEQKAVLQGEIAAMEATAQKIRAEGLKIEFRNCAEANGRTRLCVAVQPSAQRWGTEQAPFYVLKGY